MAASAAILCYAAACTEFIYCQALLWLFLLDLCNVEKKNQKKKKKKKKLSLLELFSVNILQAICR